MAKLTLADLERLYGADIFNKMEQIKPLKIDQVTFQEQLEEYQKQRFLQEKMKFIEEQKRMQQRIEDLARKNDEMQREYKLKEKLGKARDTEAGKILFDEPKEDKMSGLEGWLLDQKDFFK